MSLLVPQELHTHKTYRCKQMMMIDFLENHNTLNRPVYFQKDCLIFVQEGQKVMHNSQQSYFIGVGEALFVPMGSYAFSNIAREGIYHSKLFFFEKNTLTRFAQKYCNAKKEGREGFCAFKKSRALELFAHSLELWGEPSEEVLDLKSQELLLLLLKENQADFLSFLAKILERKNTLMEDLEIKNFLQVRDMAKEVKLETSIFSKKFKEESGISPKEWMDKKRLSKARFMLQFEGKNIQEVAYELDFGSPSWFIKRFKDYYGMTPKQFQKMSKN